MKKQQAYNIVMALLLKQGCYSYTRDSDHPDVPAGSCRYDDHKGNACAIGLWLRYNGVDLRDLRQYEGKGVDVLMEDSALKRHFILEDESWSRGFWGELQQVHDSCARSRHLDFSEKRLVERAEYLLHAYGINLKGPFNEVPVTR